MKDWKRTLAILWIGVLLCSASYTMAVPFLPLFLFDLGVNQDSVQLWAGVVHSAAFMVGAIMAPFWGSLADKYGKRKMVIRAGFSLAVIYALIAFVRTPWELLVVRMLHGFVGGFVPASMAIAASITPREKMGWSLGMMQAGTMTGGILGPLFGGLLSAWVGQRMSFIIAAIFIFIATMAVLLWVKEGLAGTAGKKVSTWTDVKGVLHNRVLFHLLLVLILFQFSFNMIQPLLTLHVADLLGEVKKAALSSGYVFAVIGLAGIIASPLWGKAGENKGYPQVLVFCLSAAGLVVSMQYFIYNLWTFASIQFVYGFFAAGIVPLINTLVVRSTDESFRGRSFGLTTSANQMGAMLGPLAGGLLGLYISIHWIFVITGILLACTGVIVLSNNKRVSGQVHSRDNTERTSI